MKALVVSILLMIAFICGCESHQICDVQKGMAKPDVEYLVGRPEVVKHYQANKQWWQYSDNEVIVFDGNFVFDVHTDAESILKAQNNLMVAELEVSQNTSGIAH